MNRFVRRINRASAMILMTSSKNYEKWRNCIIIFLRAPVALASHASQLANRSIVNRLLKRSKKKHIFAIPSEKDASHYLWHVRE